MNNKERKKKKERKKERTCIVPAVIDNKFDEERFHVLWSNIIIDL